MTRTERIFCKHPKSARRDVDRSADPSSRFGYINRQDSRGRNFQTVQVCCTRCGRWLEERCDNGRLYRS